MYAPYYEYNILDTRLAMQNQHSRITFFISKISGKGELPSITVPKVCSCDGQIEDPDAEVFTGTPEQGLIHASSIANTKSCTPVANLTRIRTTAGLSCDDIQPFPLLITRTADVAGSDSELIDVSGSGHDCASAWDGTLTADYVFPILEIVDGKVLM